MIDHKVTAAEFESLAQEYEAGLIKMTASGYEEFGLDLQRRHKMVVTALRAASALCALAELPPRITQQLKELRHDRS